MGRTEVCDGYLFLSGALGRETIEGDYSSIGIGSSSSRGSFKLRRIGDSTDVQGTPEADRFDVVFLPTDDFPYRWAAALAPLVANETHLKVRAVLNLGSASWKPDGDQYDPATLKEIALPAIAHLRRAYGGTLYVLLTTRDINSADRTLRFALAESYPVEMVSVVSVARMLPEGTSVPDWRNRVGNRLYKMVLRTIGLLYFKLPRTADPADLMFSPLMGVGALDGLEPRLELPDGGAVSDPATH